MINGTRAAFEWAVATWGMRPPSERLVMLCLAERSHQLADGTFAAEAKLVDISEWTGVSRRHVHHCMASLLADGVVRREQPRSDLDTVWDCRFGP